MLEAPRQMPAGASSCSGHCRHERTGLDTVLVASRIASPRGARATPDASATIDELLSRASVTMGGYSIIH